MVRTYQEVSKRAKKSIQIQVNKLVGKYGEKEVRLVVTKLFERLYKKRKLEETIKEKESELQKLKQKK
ncbi:hypothetical protein LCGC14_2351390 [marine sediment metagenome]|uniref:Uncharacterized protein n=1 Tax=marine sediment metagenome TaxID=412755 RepID=A0A0F9CWN2_9ZZZZ